MLSLAEAESILARHGQSQVLKFWDELAEEGREKLLSQVGDLDWERLEDLVSKYVLGGFEQSPPEGLKPAPYFPLIPVEADQKLLYSRAEQRGKELLQAGKVAAFTVAGGQGTRLGYDAPKGTYPIAPVTGKTLFELFAGLIVRTQEKYGTRIDWVIMTSPMNHAATEAFFAENAYFGLAPDNIVFFPQGTMPAFAKDGKLILAAKDSLALSPNGHGGSLQMLRDSGALARMAERGVEHISYWQVDNPLVQPFDPLFLGLHDLTESDMSCRSLTKTGPFEKLGNFCLHDGRTVVIEYSDMPDDLATEKDDAGQLAFRAGSPAIHILRRGFIDELTRGGSPGLPYHRAEKKVPYLSEDGRCVIKPDSPNAVKLEMFIFDALPLAENVLIFEARREDAFAPVKNPVGVDSVESCRELMVARAARWLSGGGVAVPYSADGRPDCIVELSTRSFSDAEDVSEAAARLRPPHQGETVYYE